MPYMTSNKPVQNQTHQIPIFLPDCKEPAALANTLRQIQANGFAPITLRELFLSRRGAKNADENACMIVMRACSERILHPLLSILRNTHTPVVLVSEERLSAGLCNELFAMPYIAVIPAQTLPDGMCADAVFCQTVDSATLRALRKRGVRMVLTEDKNAAELSPIGMDVLCVTPITAKSDASTIRTEPIPSVRRVCNSVFLPIDSEPFITDAEMIGAMLILGTNRKVSESVLTNGLWSTEYNTSDETYKSVTEQTGIYTEPVKTPLRTSMLREHLLCGKYILLYASLHQPIEADRLLLFGYEGTYDAFAAVAISSQGKYSRVDIRSETLTALCGSPHVSASLLTVDETETDSDVAAFAVELQRNRPGDGISYFDWDAAVRFANRFYVRFARGDATFSASALRNFFEERRRYGFAMHFFAEKEGLYVDSFEEYRQFSYHACDRVLPYLCAQTVLHPETSLLLVGELMRKLINMEETCRNAFSDELERAAYRREYLRRKDVKM